MYNFNSGPAALPQEVLRQAAQDILHFQKGLSILEMPHRGASIKAIIKESEELVRSLLNLDDDYEVCWMQGGGRAQFAMIPMNFLAPGKTAGFINSGHWADEAMRYAACYGQTKEIASSKEEHYRYIPEWKGIPEDLAYVHLTSNNTIYGTQFFDFPETNVPLVADMSSDLFSRKLAYTKFDLIYAVAQKNIGPAGTTLVIAKSGFLDRQNNNLPGIFSYKDLFKNHSAYNTPPVFAIYCSLLNLRWLFNTGMDTIEQRNREKAALLYQAVDDSRIFTGTAQKAHRSLMNVCFRGLSPEAEEAFLNFAGQQGITGIKGHRSVGGFRVALYNAITLEEVSHLVKAMRQFEASYQ
ncbi:MAG TPA: 3-phosphoserine/phosphohydroxythreonine transaminase [Edaphocola sp.]|nr:3-phosphoserine/phosphohydroxythreonine transaminase [Edaphocola sp.]